MESVQVCAFALAGGLQGGAFVAGADVRTGFCDKQSGQTRAVPWSDPPSFGPGSSCGGLCTIAGAWSTYWYNGEIYESDITTGLNTFALHDRVTRRTIKLERLNPQTQEQTLP
jgi:hypothetical protein